MAVSARRKKPRRDLRGPFIMFWPANEVFSRNASPSTDFPREVAYLVPALPP